MSYKFNPFTGKLDVVGLSGDLELTSTQAVYFGDPATDGSWRYIRSGDNLSVQRRESGQWVEKGLYLA